MSTPTKSRTERLAEFFARLAALPAPRTAEEALAQICSTLDEVEDAFSGVAKKDPPPPMNMPDGRMYPPLADRIIRLADGSIQATTRGHQIEISANGKVTMGRQGSTNPDYEREGAST